MSPLPSTEFRVDPADYAVRVQEAQQRLAQARNGGSEADQQAALAALHKVQAEQADRLKQIAAQLQEQIAALEYLKKN